MDLDLQTLAENIRKADTEELLDRVTVYRNQMEAVALDLMEHELSRRGLSEDQIAEHESQRWESTILDDDGTPVRCSECDRPAVAWSRGWHRLWGRMPLFPRTFAYCVEHLPVGTPPPDQLAS
jgi:hypothetical protein